MLRKKISKWLVLSVALITWTGVALALKWVIEDYTAVRFVRIEGDFDYVKKSQFKALLNPLLSRGLIMTDLNQIEQKASTIPWVDRIKAQRVWPDTLSIEIAEQIPSYRWGKDHLLNQVGWPFHPCSTAPFIDLPVIYAADGQQKQSFMGLNYMQEQLLPYGLKVAVLEIDAQNSWTLKLDAGIELKLGRYRSLAMFDRFLASLQVLGKQSIHALQKIDLRYRNGFALSLKPNAAIQWNS